MNLEFLTAKIEIPQSFELGFVKLVFDIIVLEKKNFFTNLIYSISLPKRLYLLYCVLLLTKNVVINGKLLK